MKSNRIFVAAAAAIVVLMVAAAAGAFDRTSVQAAASVTTTTIADRIVEAEAATAVEAPPAPELRFGAGRVEWFGDSLTESSETELRAAFAESFGPDAELEVTSFGGTALCDWLDVIDERLRAEPAPAVLVMSFYGNNFTGCMGAAGDDQPGFAQGSAEFYEAYASAMDQVDLWASAAGVPVAWVQAPPRSIGVDGGPVEVRDAMTDLAAERGWPILHAGEALAGSDGGFTMWLPCDDGEAAVCVDGLVKVRSDDLVHFEPGVDGPAPGSRRWSEAAMALLAEAAAD